MSKFTSRGDLLIAAGESIKMQEAAGIEPVCKFYGQFGDIKTKDFTFNATNYEFPLAVVEGKAVFVGDELYSISGNKLIITNPLQGDKNAFNYEWCSMVSWNTPKPATVMIELPREHAQELLECTNINGRLYKALSKALEEK